MVIVNDAGSYFELIPQHEHARIAALFLEHWKDPALYNGKRWNELLFAVRHHDRAWIPLDAEPLLDSHFKPYSFIDYPEKEKINAYENGIEDVTDKDLYSGLLVSRHYASFFDSSQTVTGRTFLQSERKRQDNIRKELHHPHTEEFHMKVLQFCDDISLYVCMNKPGAAKNEEVSWFKNGFRQRFVFLNNKKIHAHFHTNDTINIEPFPLFSNLEITINGIIIQKQKLVEKGMKKAYRDGKPCVRQFRFVYSNTTEANTNNV